MEGLEEDIDDFFDFVMIEKDELDKQINKNKPNKKD